MRYFGSTLPVFLAIAIALLLIENTSFGGAQRSCRSDSATKNVDECRAIPWTPPPGEGGLGIQALLKDIPISTKWADVPVTTKVQLQVLADDRLGAFRARWAGEALARKQAILVGCPTPEMLSAMDDFYRMSYNSVVPASFSLKELKSHALSKVLVQNYLGTIAAVRANLTYPNGTLPNRDWDGKSTFDSVRLPDKQTYQDIMKYNSSVVDELYSITDESLTDLERRLKERALFDARAHAVGAFTGDSYGGADMQSACEIIVLNYDVLGGYEADKGRPKMFTNDDEVLREINALYLNNIQLKSLDVGTMASAIHFCDYTGPDFVKEKVGDPATNDVAKAMILMKNWWIERVSHSGNAQNKCSVYSDHDRQQVWEAFSADQQFNNDHSSTMSSYRTQLERYRDSKIVQYREIAKLALRQVFPDDSVLTASQRQKVVAAIDAETAFGLFSKSISAALDAAQGGTNGPAATQWNNAVSADLARIGGNYGEGDRVRPADETALKAMFVEIKSWVAKQYGEFPIDIPSLYSKITFKVTTANNANTVNPGEIAIGVGTARSRLEYYSLIIHELRHAVYYAWQANAPDKTKVRNDEGPAFEGSGVAVEALLLQPFASHLLNNDTSYILYLLDYGIRDARFVGTTDATLQKYFRDGCSGANDPDGVEFAKNIAARYGLTGKLADNVAIRSHAGTQYLQYILGGLQVLDGISYLQSRIDPTGLRRVDPFVLFACGLNTPSRDPSYVAELKACMKL
ncbi:MAG TPA: hypothetical protein VN875_17535 [Candidatus Binatus sp.]|nr:hypothetical protein [Candidatus Binatus sp.]